jgi:hypothetical protein
VRRSSSSDAINKKPPENFGGFFPGSKRGLPKSRVLRGLASMDVSAPTAILPDKGNKNGDQPNGNEHPVLAVESQNGEMSDKKLQRSRSPHFFEQNKRVVWAR